MESTSRGQVVDMASLESEILDLGLEDDIPLAELRSVPEVRAAAGTERPDDEIRDVLRKLLREGRIFVLAGQWNEEPNVVTRSAALTLIDDPASYDWHHDNPGKRRVYYVNRDNMKPEQRPSE
jgi:hypothetical protein